MPDVVRCGFCDAETSRFGVYCLSCGGKISPVTRSVSRKLINGLRDEDLSDFCYQYVCSVLQERGCYQRNGPSDRLVIGQLPAGLQAGYCLVVLDSEVLNGGFLQWLTNSSGKLTQETLAAARAIRARGVIGLLRRVLQLNDAFEARFPSYRDRWNWPAPHDPTADAAFENEVVPHLEAFDQEWYRHPELMTRWNRAFIRYVRKSPESCVYRRR